MLGVLSIADAIYEAKKSGLDLVEVSPQASPPVCKILDFGKYKYEAKKKAQEAKKKQKTMELKEIKFRPNIGEGDFNVKMRNINKFLDEGNKVKVSLQFRGREIVHNDIAKQLFQRVIEEVSEKSKPESGPKLEGRQMIMILAPLKNK